MRELTRRDWLKGTSSLAAASLVYATTAQAQSVTVSGYTPTRENPIRMSSNENPYGVPRSAQNAMTKSFGSSHLYGGGRVRRELQQIIAEQNNIPAENILITGGSKEVLKVGALMVP